MAKTPAKFAFTAKIKIFYKATFLAYTVFCKYDDSLKLNISRTTDSGSMKMAIVDCNRRVDNENGINSRKICIHC